MSLGWIWWLASEKWFPARLKLSYSSMAAPDPCFWSHVLRTTSDQVQNKVSPRSKIKLSWYVYYPSYFNEIGFSIPKWNKNIQKTLLKYIKLVHLFWLNIFSKVSPHNFWTISPTDLDYVLKWLQCLIFYSCLYNI